VAIVGLPSMLSAPLSASGNAGLRNLGVFLGQNFTQNSIAYNALYFILVLGFAYFYTSVQFNAEKIAEDVKKKGGFVPGIRPGKSTERYLKNIVTKITLLGGIFLGLIAIMPFLVQSFVGISVLTIGGTGLLIVVSVVLETLRQVESMTTTRSYERFLD